MATKKQSKAPRSVWAQRFIGFLGSPLFFGLTLALFVLQAGWIALCARYPQAFDEQFHLGVIRIYAHHLNPFLASQPANADQFGAVARDPSYLYQYLMSFPYRAVSLVSQSLAVQVITLRLINILFFVSGLVLYRKVLRTTGASRAMVHTALFFIVLTPVLPLLASQINYDNLLFPLTGLALLLTIRIIGTLRNARQLPLTDVSLLALLSLLASLVKYAFLPIMAGLFIVILWEYIHSRGKHERLVPGLVAWIKRPGSMLILLAILLGLGLFWQRFGINTVKYHTPIPECDQVLNVQRCESYSPWARNYMFEQWNIHLGMHNILTYPFVWVYHSMGELVFTISSNYNQRGIVDYHTGSQLILIEIISWAVFGVGLLLVLWHGHWMLAQSILRLFVVVILLYVGVLGAQNMMDYVHIGLPVAIHGRYLLPVLPLIYLLIALAFGRTINRLAPTVVTAAKQKAWLAIIFGSLLLLEGGGFTTYILRSDPTWFWPQSSKAQTANDKVRGVLKPFILDAGQH
jgi:hypothetical protein